MACTVCQSYDVLNVLHPFIENELCIRVYVNRMQRLEGHHMMKILEVIFNQPPMNKNRTTYTLYSINIDYSNLHKVIDIISHPTNENSNHITIQSTQNQLVLHIYSPETMHYYLAKNKKIRYLFFPIGFSGNSSSDHQTILVIDNYQKCSYLIDPNGSTNYFRNTTNNSEDLVEQLLIYYFQLLYEIKCTIKFICRKHWNPYTININRTFDGTVFDQGNCVVTSIILAHYINITQSVPQKAYVEFGKLKNDMLLKIINGYTFFLSRICLSI